MPKKRSAALITLAIVLPLPVLGQPNRIAARIDSSQRISLRGHVHSKALPEFDQGAVDPALIIPDVTLVLKPSPGQEAASTSCWPSNRTSPHATTTSGSRRNNLQTSSAPAGRISTE